MSPLRHLTNNNRSTSTITCKTTQIKITRYPLYPQTSPGRRTVDRISKSGIEKGEVSYNSKSTIRREGDGDKRQNNFGFIAKFSDRIQGPDSQRKLTTIFILSFL